MPNLSKKTIRKMRAVIAAVLREPEFYSQYNFPEFIDCGETCCAAGWAVWLDSPRKYAWIFRRGVNVDWQELAQKALGLGNTGNMLFGGPQDWPFGFHWAYADAVTPIGRAKAMAARWEHFIKTDGSG